MTASCRIVLINITGGNINYVQSLSLSLSLSYFSHKFFAIAILCLVAAFFSLFSQRVFAANNINRQINFQGKLVDNNGLNVADSTYTVVFKLYDASANGTTLWTETDSVTTTDGIFRVALGANTTLPGSVDFNTDNIYLGIKVNSDTEMTPRIQFTAAPYAFNAEKLDGVVATQSAQGFVLTGGTSTLASLTLTDGITVGSTIKPTAAGALTVQSNGANGLTLDAGGAAALTIGGTNANAITFGGSQNPNFTFSGSGTFGTSTGTNTLNGDTVIASGKTLRITGGAGNPTATSGIVWYDTTANKFKIVENGTVKIVCNTTDLGCGAGGSGSNWDVVNGIITPKLTSTLDFLLGSQASTSAKLAVLNINSGTPIASLSAQNAAAQALVLGADESIQSVKMQSLTLGGSSTGDIAFKPGNASIATLYLQTGGNVGIGNQAPGAALDITGTLKTSSTVTFSSLSTNGFVKTSGGTGQLSVAGSVVLGTDVSGYLPFANGGSLWVIDAVNGVLTPRNNTLDLLVGGTATTSAKFSLLNIAGGIPQASISAQNAAASALVLGADESIQSVKLHTLTLGGSSTGDIAFKPGNASNPSVYFQSGGNVGIGTATPLAALDVNGNLVLGANSTIDTRASGTLTIGNGANTTALTLGKSGATTTFNSTSWTATPTISGLITATSGVSIAANQSYTGAGAVTLSSASNTNLTLTPGGSGQTILSSDFDSGVLVGASSNTPAPLSVSGGIGSNASFIVNNKNSGDLVAASSSGTTKFQLTNGGVLNLAGGGTSDIDVLSATTLKIGITNPSGITIGKSGITTTVDSSLTLTTGRTLTVNGDAFTDLTGNGLAASANALSVNPYSGSGLLSDTTGLSLLRTCSDQQILKWTLGTSTWACAADSTGAGGSGNNWWSLDTANGVLYPGNLTVDTLFGGSASTSARLRIGSTLNSGTTPVSSISAQTSYAAEVVDNRGIGDIFTASSSGNTRFVIKQNGVVGIGNSNPTLAAGLQVTANYTLTGDLVEIGNSAGIEPTVTGANALQLDWRVKPASGNTTASQRINITNANTGAGGRAGGLRMIATGSGGAIASTTVGLLLDGLLSASTGVTNQNAIQIGTNWDSSIFGEGDLRINAGSNIIFATSSANTKFGIGTNTPLAGVDIRGIGPSFGTTAIASISGQTSFAALVIDNSGVGDILTASSSGLNRFVIKQGGNVGIGVGLNPLLAAFDVRGLIGTSATATISAKSSFAAMVVDNAGVGAIFTASSSGNTRFVINANGGVGIGVATPSARLEVSYFADATHAAMFTNQAQSANSRVLGLKGSTGVTNRWIDFMNQNGLVLGKVRGNANNTSVVYDATGGDFAEYFKKEDPQEQIGVGDLVCLSQNGNATRCGRSQKTIIGIYSDNAGFVGAGGHEEDPNYVLVGLVGQLHLNVSTENGEIRPGDSLTASSATGVAAKATKAGRILGKALEGYSGAGVGKVLVLINPTYFTGISAIELFSGLQSNQDNISGFLLTQFISQKDQLVQSKALSEITTDRVAAGLEVISPKVVTQKLLTDEIKPATGSDIALQLTNDGKFVIKDPSAASGEASEVIIFDSKGNAFFKGAITADKIKANQIEGLEFSIRNQVLGVKDLMASHSAITSEAKQSGSIEEIATGSSNLHNDSSILTLQSLSVDGLATISANLRVKGNGFIEGVFTVIDTLTTHNLIVAKLAEFFDSVIFHGDVVFEGRPTFNKDSAGFAVIKKDADRVEVVFEKEYESVPAVAADIVFDQVSVNQELGIKNLEDAQKKQKALEKAVLGEDIHYIVTGRTTKGFTIALNKPATEDITFSWVALAVKEGKTFQSRVADTPAPTAAPAPSLTPVPTGVPPISPGAKEVSN